MKELKISSVLFVPNKLKLLLCKSSKLLFIFIADFFLGIHFSCLNYYFLTFDYKLFYNLFFLDCFNLLVFLPFDFMYLILLI